MSTIRIVQICWECMREFNLMDEQESNEFYYGHDCEDVTA